VCASVQAIKYIHKYIYKGQDKITVRVSLIQDEIEAHIQAKYIGSAEAMWRLMEFAVHGEYPSVMHLAIHCPGEHTVRFPSDATSDEVRELMVSAKSTLMAFFDYNNTHADGRHLLYQNFPSQFTYNMKGRQWTIRKRGFAIGRIYHCNPFQGEQYYIRMLLTVVPGVKSFAHLRTVNGTEHPTFWQACLA
jgi:hypothetical protein